MDLVRAEGVVDAYINHLYYCRDNPQPVDESRPETYPQAVLRAFAPEGTEYAPPTPEQFAARFTTEVTDEPRRTWGQRRLDAFLDLFDEIALARADQIDPERACIGVTVDYQTLVERAPGTATLDSGRVITGEAARRLACERRITQIHHIIWWENGGITAIINGVPLCSTHHHLVHEGQWTVNYNPTTGITRFEGPRGQVVESTGRMSEAA